MNLIEFYQRLLTSMGLLYTKDGYIEIMDGETTMPILLSGKSLVLPTSENINSLVTTNENGENEVTKLPFNPIHEDSLKGDTKCFQQMKIIMEKRLGHTLAGLGELLLTMASDKSLQTKNTLAINKFLNSINNAKTPHNSTGRNKLIDDKSVENWLKLYEYYINKPVGLVAITSKRSAKLDGVKHNRLATLICPLYDALLEANADTPVNGVKLRNKDIAVFKLLIEFMLEGIGDHQCLNQPSDDREYPAFISLTKLYISIMGRLMSLVKNLKDINPVTGESIYLEISLSENDIDNIHNFKHEIITIPEEFDLIGNSNKKSSKMSSIKVDQINNAPSLRNTNPILADAASNRNAHTVSASVEGKSIGDSDLDKKLDAKRKELEYEQELLELEKKKMEISKMRESLQTTPTSQAGYVGQYQSQPYSSQYNLQAQPIQRNISENDPVLAAGRSIGSPMVNREQYMQTGYVGNYGYNRPMGQDPYSSYSKYAYSARHTYQSRYN